METSRPGTRPAANAAAAPPPGVRIIFSAGNGPWQTLYYFSTNLADGGVTRSGFLTFCGKLGVADSFIKSASYLLHSGGFNKVRDFLLEHSATILQDDSGIPLVYFDPKKWRLQPFGRYVPPLSIFPRAYQPRMAELFRKATPIEFGLGYRWRKNESESAPRPEAPNRDERERIKPPLDPRQIREVARFSANAQLKTEGCLPRGWRWPLNLGRRTSKTHRRATAPRLGAFRAGPQSRLDVASPYTLDPHSLTALRALADVAEAWKSGCS